MLIMCGLKMDFGCCAELDSSGTSRLIAVISQFDIMTKLKDDVVSSIVSIPALLIAVVLTAPSNAIYHALTTEIGRCGGAHSAVWTRIAR